MEQKKLVTTFPFAAVEKKQHNHETEEIEFNFCFHHNRGCNFLGLKKPDYVVPFFTLQNNSINRQEENWS
jgi:hypothetical protein